MENDKKIEKKNIRFSIDFDKKLHKIIKIRAATRGITLKKWITYAIWKLMKEEKEQGFPTEEYYEQNTENQIEKNKKDY